MKENEKEEHKEHAEHAKEHRAEDIKHMIHKDINKERSSKKMSMWKILTFVLVVLLVISIVTRGFNFSGTSTGTIVSKEQAKATAEDFIKKNLIQPGVTIIVNDVKEENGLYSLAITVTAQGQTQNVNSYITKDGQIFFPQGINIETFGATNPSTTNTGNTNTQPQNVPKTNKPAVELYVMAFCPYGMQAENAMSPVFSLLGDKADIQVHFIASVTGTTPDSIQSLHGPVEAQEDLRQVCIMKNYDQATVWKYIDSINSDCSSKYRDASYEDCWKSSAESAGIDVAKIETCSTGTEGVNLMKAEDALASENGVSGSPTMFINGVTYSGARTSEAYKTAICNAFTTAPSECTEALSNTATTAAGNCGT
jgi:predicted DsbA family dithiol-disulfide isomerase